MKTHEALKVILRLAKERGASRKNSVAIRLIEKFIDDDVWDFGDLADYDEMRKFEKQDVAFAVRRTLGKVKNK